MLGSHSCESHGAHCHNTGKWRLITDLRGASVNDAPCPTRLLKTLPRPWALAPSWQKPQHIVLLQGGAATHTSTRYCLSGGPKIFSAVADAFAWQLHQMGIPDVDHYLDDFIVLGSDLA